MTQQSTARRYALYFTPEPSSAWAHVWSRWLGRSIDSGLSCQQPPIKNLEPALFHALTGAPRRYGLHATLKAPFSLAPDRSAADLEHAIREYCVRQRALLVPSLQVKRIDRFLALAPSIAHSPIHRIAADCVQLFDSFRAPAGDQETARRKHADLDNDEAILLARWGYPYVLHRFRFHLTLTGPLDTLNAQQLTNVIQAAQMTLASISEQPLVLDALSILTQTTPHDDFELVARIPFATVSQ